MLDDGSVSGDVAKMKLVLMLCCVCYFLLLIPLYYLIRYFRGLLKVANFSEKAVFITGCDSGFGRSLALKCAERGMTVFAGCLTKEGEQSLKNEGGEACGSLRTVHLDITNQESVEKALVFTEMQLSGSLRKLIASVVANVTYPVTFRREVTELWALVNNAGFLALYGPDDWCSIEDYEHSLKVNTLGHIRVIHVSDKFHYPVGTLKELSRLRSRSLALRYEVRPFGITCCTIELGTFRTDFIDSASINARLNSSWEKLTHKKKAKYGEDYKNMYIAGVDRKIQKGSSPCLDRVVDCYYHAITARYPRLRYRCGCDAHFFAALSYLPTAFADSIVLALCKTNVVPAILTKDKKEQ
uniref:Estradiol 17-beta-dehydrogenase 2 n=1 Tax=Ascaris lumbricoides TaxID=6252 RepID=A0A0M3I4I3_ASCLU